MQIYTRLQLHNAKVKSDGSGSKGLTHVRAACFYKRWPASTKDCTSGNETPSKCMCQCADTYCRLSYSYTVIVSCTVLYDVPTNIAYKTLSLSKYFIQVLSFATLVHITQTATRVGPNYTLHSRN